MTEPVFYQALAYEKGVYKCCWCPCIFSTQDDFIRHWKAIGKLRYDHVRKWKEMQEHSKKFG